MRINSSKIIPNQTKVNIINEDSVYPFHDREIELYGISWLEDRIKELKQNQDLLLLEICNVISFRRKHIDNFLERNNKYIKGDVLDVGGKRK